MRERDKARRSQRLVEPARLRLKRVGGEQTPSIAIQGSKNVFLSVLTLAFAIADGSVALVGAPETSDLGTVCELVTGVGLKLSTSGPTTIIEGPPSCGDLDDVLGRRLRHTISYACALAANTGRSSAPVTGGDAFTKRPIDIHLRLVEAAGGRYTMDGRTLEVAFSRRPQPFDVSVRTSFGPDASAPVGSLGASVSAIAIAMQADGWSAIHHVPREPEVEAVIAAARALGTEHVWQGTTLRVRGRGGVAGDAVVTIPPDRIEAGTYALIGSLSSGTVTLAGIGIEEFPIGFVEAIRDAGIEMNDVASGRRGVIARLEREPRAVSVRTQPHPGFPTDLQPQLCAFLSQAEGESTIEETMYASRVSHVHELAQLGVAVEVSGRSQRIRGKQRVCAGSGTVRDIRCGASLLVAAAASSEPVDILDPERHLARGYSKLVTKLGKLGFSVETGHPDHCLRLSDFHGRATPMP